MMITQENWERRKQSKIDKYSGVKKVKIVKPIPTDPQPTLGEVYEVLRVEVQGDKVLFVVSVDGTEVWVYKEEVEIL